MTPLKTARLTTLISYFGLMTLLVLWNTLIAPSKHFPVAMVLIVLVIPLLFPLRGILHERPYTHAWASFLALFYFVHAVGEFAAAVDSLWLAGLEILFSVGFFSGCVAFARLKGRAEKTNLDQNRSKP